MDRTTKEQIIQVGPLQLWLFCYGFSSNELTADNVRFYFAVDAKILASYGVGSFRVVTLDEVGFCDASTKQQAFDLISEHEYKHNNKHWINVGFQVAYITDLQYDVLIRRYRAYSAGGIQFNVSEVKVYE